MVDRNAQAPQDDDAPLHGDFRDMAEQFMRLLREDDERQALIRAADAARDAEEDRLRAERARSGESGPEWRVIQSRIDLGQTTVEAVFSGVDQSAEAQALRALSERNLTALRDSWSEEDDDDAEAAPTPDEIFEQTLQESRDRFEAAAGRIRDALQELDRREEGWR